MDYFDNWVVQIRKGLLELGILNALKGEERYGYDIVKVLINVPGLGITEGTVYPLLSRLRVQGLVKTKLVESPEGPARKYYSLTERGEQLIDEMNNHFDILIKGSNQLREKEIKHDEMD
ncbi:PadR family transcriptional regulator [bacterium]|nr:PadR family transcriptional regulator [bacterium]